MDTNGWDWGKKCSKNHLNLFWPQMFMYFVLVYHSECPIGYVNGVFGITMSTHKKSLYIIRKAMLSRSFQYPLVNSHITTEKSTHFSWENSRFQWPFSMSQTVSHYQRVTMVIYLYLMVKTHGFPLDFPNKTNPLKMVFSFWSLQRLRSSCPTGLMQILGHWFTGKPMSFREVRTSEVVNSCFLSHGYDG